MGKTKKNKNFKDAKYAKQATQVHLPNFIKICPPHKNNILIT
jgi:hypothetical protein